MSASQADPVVRISNVSQRYGQSVALDDVTLDLPAGKMIGLVGPDGVGKSTLLALISGVRKIQRGRVQALGGDLANRAHRTAICSRIAYMPQGLGKNLYPTLSVFENVDFFGRLFGQSAEERSWRIQELLESTALVRFADRPAGKLSGGMKQKLGLCCSLIHDPDLLILDEPTTGVDPLSRRQFWELIDRIRSRRPAMSVLVATAYMEEAERFDWLVAMDAGKALATGSAAEIKARAGTRTLEEAFIALLPEAKRARHQTIVVPPRETKLDGEVAIEAEGLTMRFGNFTAVDHVSFRIERGEIFGFLGSNGCGKTTTMKMLTGLLQPTEGTARLFGRVLDPGDLETRNRVGFMSQSFSLYGELTVAQNLDLHARLYHLPASKISARLADLVDRFGLEEYLDEPSGKLPLGIRQRLSLAVAVVHEPETLILDEPTSGVDPVARDQFWELLIYLARERGVTIFVCTHFMNEAERCDRISLMHAGRVLACDTPAALVAARRMSTLEDAFIAYLEDVVSEAPAAEAPARVETVAGTSPQARGFSLQRLLAYALRETLEIRRDPVRLAFALFGTVLLMLIFGYGMTMDVERIAYAVLDRDDTTLSRDYRENVSGSRYFSERRAIRDYDDLEKRMRSGELQLALEIPPGFARDVKRDRSPEIGAWIDGAMPFRAETARGYVNGLHQSWLAELSRKDGLAPSVTPTEIRVRYRYNQDFKSIYAMVPCVVALLLIFIPAVLMAVGVVGEKEMGSITNFYATPVTRIEFLFGKQLPYACIGVLNFFIMLVIALFIFHVPLKGSFLALAAGAVLYVWATTGLGLVMSSFTTTQLAAIFGTAIATMMPATQFAGMMTPVSALTGGARAMGMLFPTTYFMKISVGTFTKALGFAELLPDFLALAAFIPAFTLLSVLFLKKQEQ